MRERAELDLYLHFNEYLYEYYKEYSNECSKEYSNESSYEYSNEYSYVYYNEYPNQYSNEYSHLMIEKSPTSRCICGVKQARSCGVASSYVGIRKEDK